MKAINRRWFSIKANGDTAELSIFDEIGGWGVLVSDFKKEFDAIRGMKAITLLLNSPGGSVFDGMALYNILATVREKLTVRVIGIAASIASVISLAGSKLVMAEATYFMIHNPWAVAVGPAEEMRKTAALLDSVKSQMVDIYAAHSDLSKEEIEKRMDDETWMTAQETKDAGFAQELEQGAAVAALGFSLDKYSYHRTPDGVRAKSNMDRRPPQTVRDFEQLLRDEGFSRSASERIAAKGFDSDLREAGAAAGSAENDLVEIRDAALQKTALRM